MCVELVKQQLKGLVELIVNVVLIWLAGLSRTRQGS